MKFTLLGLLTGLAAVAMIYGPESWRSAVEAAAAVAMPYVLGVGLVAMFTGIGMLADWGRRG